MERADVIIVGAGPAGSTAAALLAQKGWDVLLLDRAQFPRDKTCGDGLTPRAVAVLERLGLVEEFRAAGYQVVNGARVISPRGDVLDVRFKEYGPLLGLPQLGFVIPRYEFDERMRQRAVARGARFQAGVHVRQPFFENGCVAGVEGDTGDGPFAVRAPLTILATGANIGLLKAFGVLAGMPPGVNAMRGYYTGVAGLTDEFEFYFDREIHPGYAWVFPLQDGLANVGVSYFARGKAREEAGSTPNVRRMLDDFLARHSRFRNARLEGPIKGFPLRTDFPSHTPVGPGYLIVGESVGLVNPATGEGIDFAMESALLAADVADGALGRHDTSAKALRPYARQLAHRYAGLFRGLHVVQRLAMTPYSMTVLVHKAQRKPRLARMIAGVTLATVSPWSALAPRIWWDILT